MHILDKIRHIFQKSVFLFANSPSADGFPYIGKCCQHIELLNNKESNSTNLGWAKISVQTQFPLDQQLFHIY